MDDLLLLDDGRLVTGSHIAWLLDTLPTARVRSQVSDLTNMTTALATWFLISKEYARDLVQLF